MKKILFLILLFIFGGVTASAQDNTCPPNMVCLTREAAVAALAAQDRVKALEAEIKVKDAGYASLKDALNDMRVEFARTSGENTILKQQAVRDAALIELFSKMVRPKKIGLNIF